MPPPPLFRQTIVSSAPARAAASRPPMSCSRASSPVSRKTGSPAGQRGAGGRRHDAVDAVGAPVGEEAQRAWRTRGSRPRRRARASRSSATPVRRLGQRRLERGQQAGSNGSSTAWSAGRTSASACAPALEPARVGVATLRMLERGSQGVAGRCGRGVKHQLRGAGGLVPGGVRVDHHLRRVGQPGAQRLRRGHVAEAQHELGAGARRRSPRRAAARRSARSRASGRGGRSARPRWARPAAASRPARPGAPRGSATRSATGPHTIAPRGAPAARSASSCTSFACGRARVLAQLGPGPAVRATGPVLGVQLLRRPAPAARAAGSSGAPAPAGRRRRSSRRGRRGRGGGPRSRGPARGCPPPRTTWRRSRRARAGRSTARRPPRAAPAAGRR